MHRNRLMMARSARVWRRVTIRTIILVDLIHDAALYETSHPRNALPSKLLALTAAYQD
jgi:hypothetical protein